MPPEPLPFDRKDFFKERKHERSSESLGSFSRWRETPHHGSSSREFSRWGSFRSKPAGHGKQGGNLFSEEYRRGFMFSHANDKILDDESSAPSGWRGDGKSSRNSRENRGSSNQNDWRGISWETGASPNGPGRPYEGTDHRLADDVSLYNPHPHSDSVNTWDHDKSGGVNGVCTTQKLERENSLGSIDWKSIKWTRSGSLSSRGSGFSHSSSSKSIGVDSNEAKAEMQPSNIMPVQVPSGDAITCVTSSVSLEETSSKKKPRLGWGEGLAKYEKKKVEGPEEGATKNGLGITCSAEPINSHISSLADKSPRVGSLSDCASPATPSSATPSSFACSSSPGVEDRPFVKAGSIDNDHCNFGGSPMLVAQNPLEGFAFNLENMDVTQISNLSSSLSELLQTDNLSLVGPSFGRSTVANKLLVWKGDILKALEMTESEIDLLENELKLLISEYGNKYPCPSSSSSVPAKPCEALGTVSDLIPRPCPLQPVSFEDIVLEKVVCTFEEEQTEVKDKDIDSPGTVTSKSIEPLSTMKATSLCDKGKLGECPGKLDACRSGKLEMKCPVFDRNEEKTAVPASEDGVLPVASCSSVAFLNDMNLYCEGKDIFNLILASNKDTADRSSQVFNKLLPTNQCHIDIMEAAKLSCRQNKSLIMEKFARRKRFLRFKERVITLKFRVLQHLWKEDIRLLSARKYRAKSQKRFELGLRTSNNGYQKHRSSYRSRFSSPGGNLSLVPTTEVINYISKLLSDSQVILYRNTLKMPSLILDKREKMISRFISSNGLVEDPCAFEKERAMINPWTSEEKEIFMDKLAISGKNFSKIASFLDHKTTADCIEFYYKNHKSDCFKKTKKKPEFAKQKSFSTNGYLVTSGRKWNSERNAASLDMLGAASAIAANAEDGMEIQQNCTERYLGMSVDYRTPRGDDGISERSSSLNVLGSEREAAAADVLAGICGSMSSEAMSSCITSSFEPGEGYQEWKSQKVGSLTRRPLTPEVTQSVDGETCSDESCGEMDPTDWTDDEKSIFIQAVSSYGKDFAMISQCVGTRSRDQCKVFFSKARKCLGLDAIHHGHDNGRMTVSDNGGGSDTEDACVVETGSVVGSDKSGTKMDEDLPFSDQNINHGESDPVGTMNLQTEMNRSVESNRTGHWDSRDHTECRSENMVTDDVLAEGKPGLDFDGECGTEIGADMKSLTAKVHDNAVLSSNTETGHDEATGDSLEDAASVGEGNDCHVSTSGAEVENKLGDVSAEHLRAEPEVQQLLCENNLHNKPDNNRDVNGDSSFLTADMGSTSGVDVSPRKQYDIDLAMDPGQRAHVISVQKDDCIATMNSVPQDTSTVHEKTPSQDALSSNDFVKMGDKQCQKSVSVDEYHKHLSGPSLLGSVESSQILRGYPLQVSTKKEMNGDISCKKLASPQSHSKLEKNFYLSQDWYFRKCNSTKADGVRPELSFMSQEQARDQMRLHSPGLLDVEKPGKSGDVKLFGKILLPSSHQKLNSDTCENEDWGSHCPQSSEKCLNLKFNGSQSIGGNLVPGKVDRNNYLGLENLPMRTYGFWDGNRIQTGLPSLPDSAMLRAKYPAAFSNYTTPSSTMEQHPLHSAVKGNGHSLNGIFPTREIIGSGTGVADCQVYRNRDGTNTKHAFTVDMKQRHDILVSEMDRPNGSIQHERGGGVVGIDVMGRGGVVVGGGACTGVSDPVAAIKMHYAKAEQQYGGHGHGGSIIRKEESWIGRGGGDIGSR